MRKKVYNIATILGVTLSIILLMGFMSRTAADRPTFKHLYKDIMFNANDGCMYRVLEDRIHRVGCPKSLGLTENP